jgi:TRAP-type C4-dicarboxylate transport system substrate-binding protein
VADPLVFVVNKDIWASWTPADREAVRQAAIEAGKEEIAMARKGLAEPGQPLLKDIAALGVTITELTPDERAAFVKATAGLRQVEAAGGHRAGHHGREGDRGAQEVSA